jgi:hypothetical protein
MGRVYYAATTTEARLCGDEEVAVVGGARSSSIARWPSERS